MEYSKRILLKNGKECIIRNTVPDDAEEMISVFNQTHAETDFLMSYPDENDLKVEDERDFLEKKNSGDGSAELCAVVGGMIVGSAGIDRLGRYKKLKHRAEFGISVLKDYWGLGIGLALTDACIECAKRGGFTQLELDAVADNIAAISLYKKVGFVEYGRNPKGFRTRENTWQELVLMRLELR